MATLIPALGSCSGRMTPGERRFAQRLEELLEDDYLCWYDIPIGPKARHPDFIILHPKRGLLVLEVKDWKPESILQLSKDGVDLRINGRPTRKTNPLEQAR